MFKAMVIGLLVLGAFACKKKAVGHTTTHSNVTSVSNTGEVKSSDTTTTTTDHADGTQTVKSTVTTEHTVPAPSDAQAR